MPLSKQNKEKRNQHIKERFRYHRKKNPKWDIIYVIDEVAKEVYLSNATVTKILKEKDEPVPCVDTVVSRTKHLQLTIF